MWYVFAKKKFDTAIAALWLSPKDVNALGIEANWTKNCEPCKNDEYHVTMMYLGSLDQIEGKKDLIEKSFKDISKQFKPFTIELGGVTKFFSDKENQPLVSTINAPEIEELRRVLVDTFNKLDIHEREDGPSFVPHMTLGYICEDFDLNSVKINKREVKIKSLVLSWGGDLKYFDLG